MENDPWLADARREQRKQLEFEGSAYNSSLEERLRDCTGETIAELQKIEERIRDGSLETNRILGKIESHLATIGLVFGLIFWGAIIYAGYQAFRYFIH
jgi:hypothetical protein